MNYSIWKKTLKAIGIMALSVSAIACTSDDDKPVKTNELTIADVLKAEDGVTFTNLECVTVVAANTQGVLLQENGSSIYAFIGEKHNFTIGDMVTVESGTTATYNKCRQFTKGAKLVKTWHGKFKQPKPAQFTAKDIDAYMKETAPEIKYVSFSGVLSVSGNYVNVEIDGTDNIASIDYMSDEFKEKYNNHNVTISGWLTGSYNTYMYIIPVDVKDNGEYQEYVPEGAIFYSSFDKEKAVQDKDKYQTAKGWPALEQFDGWMNGKGSGAANVEYDYQEMSVRSNQESKGPLSCYEGTGKNNLLFCGSEAKPNHFTICKIAVPSEKLRLTFGAQYYSQGSTNTFLRCAFLVQLSEDGKTWSPALDYDFGGVENTPDGKWRRATADFTLPAGTKTLYIRFSSKNFSTNRLDDVLLTEGNGGQAVEFGKVVVVPVSKISDVIAKPVDNMYKIAGTVIATHTKGFLVQDNTGTILVFKKGHTMEAGKTVTIEGPTTEYGGMKQFDGISEVNVTGSTTIKEPAAEEFKAAQANAYVNNAPAIKYITFTGTLKSYRDNIFQWHNNVEIEGTDVKFTLSYVDESFQITKYEGEKIIVKGYTLGKTESDNVKYISTMVTSLEPVEKEEKPEEKDAITVTELNEKLKVLTSGSEITSDIAIAVKGYVAANNEGGSLKGVIALVDNTGAAHSGIILKGENHTETTLPVGTKVIVSLKSAKYTVSKNLPAITNFTIYPTEEKVSIKVPEIADNQISDYIGQYVCVKDVTSPDYSSTWYNSNYKGGHSFVGKNGTTVTVYAVSAAKFGKETFSANKTGNVKGVAELYDSKLEIIPTCSADVAAFK